MQKQTTPKPALAKPALDVIVRKARKAGGLTLEQLAEKSGVSKSMLSQIERGTVSPTFSVLWNLTQSLGIDLSALDQSASDRNIIEHTRSYSTPSKGSVDGKCTLRMLTPNRTVLPVEWYQLTIAPDGVLDSEPHAAGTYEHLTCTRGNLHVQSGELTATADTGDTVRYRADVPHSIRNVANHEAEGFLVVALPAQYQAHRI